MKLLQVVEFGRIHINKGEVDLRLTHFSPYRNQSMIYSANLVTVGGFGLQTSCTREQLPNPLDFNPPPPCISESCIKIKINLNFYFHTSL